jgi:hypothetical protein
VEKWTEVVYSGGKQCSPSSVLLINKEQSGGSAWQA